MERKIISVDLQQENTQDRVARLFLVKLSGRELRQSLYRDGLEKTSLDRKFWIAFS